MILKGVSSNTRPLVPPWLLTTCSTVQDECEGRLVWLQGNGREQLGRGMVRWHQVAQVLQGGIQCLGEVVFVASRLTVRHSESYWVWTICWAGCFLRLYHFPSPRALYRQTYLRVAPGPGLSSFADQGFSGNSGNRRSQTVPPLWLASVCPGCPWSCWQSGPISPSPTSFSLVNCSGESKSCATFTVALLWVVMWCPPTGVVATVRLCDAEWLPLDGLSGGSSVLT